MLVHTSSSVRQELVSPTLQTLFILRFTGLRTSLATDKLHTETQVVQSSLTRLSRELAVSATIWLQLLPSPRHTSTPAKDPSSTGETTLEHQLDILGYKCTHLKGRETFWRKIAVVNGESSARRAEALPLVYTGVRGTKQHLENTDLVIITFIY